MSYNNYSGKKENQKRELSITEHFSTNGKSRLCTVIINYYDRTTTESSFCHETEITIRVEALKYTVYIVRCLKGVPLVIHHKYT